MSPRAACRLEALGFETVLDYELGIADWKAAGLPTEGDERRIHLAQDAMRPDIPTCAPGETVGEVAERLRNTGWDDCLVVDCNDLVIGRLRSSSLGRDPAVAAEKVMQSGPTTVRPNEPLDGLAKRMDRRPTPLIVVTTPQGQLLGVVVREDANRVVAGEAPELIWEDCEGCPGRRRPAD